MQKKREEEYPYGQKALDAHYRDGFPFEQYQGCAGVMQQYIFYYDLKGETK